MQHFVYLWFDRKRKMYYVGSRTGSPDDGYVASSRWLVFEHRYRPHDFKRRILSYHISKEEAIAEEYRLIKSFNPEEFGSKYYNLKAGRKIGSVAPNKGKPLSEKTRAKISKANSGKIPWNKGKKTPKEIKDKISKTRSMKRLILFLSSTEKAQLD